MSGMDAGSKGNSDGSKAKKGGGFLDGLRSFGSDFLEAFSRNIGGGVGSVGVHRSTKSSVDRRDPVAVRDRPIAAKQIQRRLKIERQAADEKDVAPKEDAATDGKETEAAADEQQTGGAAADAVESGGASAEAPPANEEKASKESAKAENEGKQSDAVTDDAPPAEEKPSLSVAAKLKGVHRKIFRTETPGGGPPGPPPKVDVPASDKPSDMANAGASQASTIASQPAAGSQLGTMQLGGNAQLGAVKPVVNIEPLIGKVQQAKAMVDIWVTKPNVPTAAALQSMLGAVIPKLQELATGQFTAKVLEEKMKAAAAELAAIEIYDEEYKFYSLGQAGKTLLNAKKQLTVSDVKNFEWDKTRVDLWPAFQRQVQEQKDGMNAQLAVSWSENREKYKAGAALGPGKGRSKEGTALQKEYQKRTGPLGGDAAPHNSDQIAGGCADPTGVPAERSVNSSIGPQWTDPDRIGKIDKAVEKLKTEEGEPGMAVTQMNVQLNAVQV